MGVIAKYRFVVKWVLYAILGVAAIIAQRYVFSRLDIAGITPILMGSLAVAVGMFEGAAPGAIYGCLCGFMMYTSGGNSELLYATVYASGGFAAGMLCDRLLKKNIAGAMLASLVVNAVAGLLYFIFLMWLPGRAGLYAMLRAGLPEIAYSTALMPLMYAPVRLLSRMAGSAED